MSSQVRRVLCAGVVLGFALVGCGGGGDGVSLPSERPGSGRPTLSTPAAPTASESEAARPTVPSVAVPSATRPPVALPTRTTAAPPAATTPDRPATTVPRTT